MGEREGTMARWTLAFAFIVVLAFVVLSLISRRQPKTGLAEGRLRTCPDTPNCVCSEDSGKASFVEPLPFSGNPERAWEKLRKLVGENGGRVQREEKGYLWATFTTKLFRFVDDVELRLEEERGLIHIRSASRVGYSDMSVNRKRVERLRAKFHERKG